MLTTQKYFFIGIKFDYAEKAKTHIITQSVLHTRKVLLFQRIFSNLKGFVMWSRLIIGLFVGNWFDGQGKGNRRKCDV